MSGEGEITKEEIKKTICNLIDDTSCMLFISKSEKDGSTGLYTLHPENLFETMLPLMGNKNEISAWLTCEFLDMFRQLAFEDSDVYQSLKMIISEVENNLNKSISGIDGTQKK